MPMLQTVEERLKAEVADASRLLGELAGNPPEPPAGAGVPRHLENSPLRAQLEELSRDLRDAAVVDGYGHLAFLRSVGIPLVRSTIAALGLLSFLLAWNQYLWPLLVTNRDDRRTVQIGLGQLAGTVGSRGIEA